MARTRSLAGQAASAARKVVARRGKETETVEQTDTSSSNGQTPATSAKKSPAASASKKSATSKSTGAKSASKKATAQKSTSAKKSTSAQKSTPAKDSPAKKTTGEKGTAKKAASTKKSTPAKKSASTKKSTSAKKTAPAKKTTSAKKSTPVKKTTTAKKRTAKKAAPADLVVREDEHAWTSEELAEVLAELHEQRKHSLEVIGLHETELDGLMREPGDGAGHDQADVGSSAFERDHELQVLGNERDKLTQIDRAVARIDDGSYGQCERCGNPIGKMRLMAFPRATLCMTCKQREERR